MAEQRHSQSPPESQLWEGGVRLSSRPPPPHTPPTLTPGLVLSPSAWHQAQSGCSSTPQRSEPRRPGGHSPVGPALWTRSLRSAQPPFPPAFCSCTHSRSRLPSLLTVQGCGRSPGPGHRGLRRQEWAASSAVGSRTPCGSAGPHWHLHQSLHTAQPHGRGAAGTAAPGPGCLKKGSRGPIVQRNDPLAFVGAQRREGPRTLLFGPPDHLREYRQPIGGAASLSFWRGEVGAYFPNCTQVGGQENSPNGQIPARLQGRL